jgi:hypothetical protein
VGDPDLSGEDLNPQGEDLNPQDPRGLVIFPDDRPAVQPEPAEQWWLVLVALALVATMIVIAFAVR